MLVVSTYYLKRERVFITNNSINNNDYIDNDNANYNNNNDNNYDSTKNKRFIKNYDSEDSDEKELLSENNSVSPFNSNN